MMALVLDSNHDATPVSARFIKCHMCWPNYLNWSFVVCKRLILNNPAGLLHRMMNLSHKSLTRGADFPRGIDCLSPPQSSLSHRSNEFHNVDLLSLSLTVECA